MRDAITLSSAFAFSPGISGIPRPSARESALVEAFRQRPLIILSPHLDDACFSLGCFLHRVGHGELVNIFTQGAFAPALTPHDLSAERVRALRVSEDRHFAALCRLKRHELGAEEPSLRGRRPSELFHIEDDIGQIEGPLLRLLARLAPPGGTKPALFAPLGIGRHVNHRAVSETVYRNLEFLAAQFDLQFYEDLPYAADPMQRRIGLARLKARMGTMRRHVVRAPWAEKKCLIAIYPSQGPYGPGRFRPCSLWPLGLHEAFWAKP